MDKSICKFRVVSVAVIIFLSELTLIPLASTNENFNRSTTRAFFENQIADQTLSIDQRLAYTDSLMELLQAGEKHILMIKRAQILGEGCRYDEAVKQYDLSLREIPKDSVRLRLMIMPQKAANAFYASHYRESSSYALALLKTDKPDSLLWLDIEMLSILAAMDGYRGNNNITPMYYQYMEECLKRLEKSGAHSKTVNKARTRILIWRAVKERDLHKAFNMYMQAKNTTTDSVTIDGLNNNLGLIHNRLGDYVKSRPYFERVLRSHRPGTARLCAVMNYIISYINEKNGRGADSAIIKYGHILDELDGTPFEWEKYNILYNIHLLNGRQLEGVPYLERALELLDSLHSIDNNILATDITKQVSELMIEKKYAPQLSNNKKKTAGIMILCGALLITGCALWIFFRMARYKESEAGEIASRLDETLTRHREEKKEIDESLQMRGQELTSLKLRAEMLRNALDSIVAEVSRHESPHSEVARKVREIVKSLSGTEKSFNPRSITLENVNQAFFDKLYKRCPELTNAERDMCGYALMSLQPKEIAAITNRSVKTVSCIRHNLRKKLGIPVTESTEAYMRRLSASDNEEDMLISLSEDIEVNNSVD